MQTVKEKIVMEKEIITDNEVWVSSDCTEFCHMVRRNYPDIHKLEQDVKGLRKQLKEKNISIGKTNTLKTLKEQKQDYIKMVADYNKTFDELTIAWNEKMKDGIYYGCIDDVYLNNIIYPLQHKLTKMNYRNTLLSVIPDIKRSVDEINKDLKNGTNFIKVSI